MSASYRKFTYQIAVGATQLITRQGDFFHVTDADGDFSVAWDNGAPTPFFVGLTYEVPAGEMFNNVLITNDGAAPLNIEVGIGAGGVRDGRLTISNNKTTVLQTETRERATRFVPLDRVELRAPVPQVLVPANTARKEVIINNLTTINAHLYDVAVTGGPFFYLAAGAQVVLPCQNALWITYVGAGGPGVGEVSGQYVELAEVEYV